MKFLLLLALQATLAFKLEPEGFELKKSAVIRPKDKIFPFKMVDFDPTEKFSLTIKAVHQEGKQEKYTLSAEGTGDEINQQLSVQKLPIISAHVENYKASVVLKNLKTGKIQKFDYTFQAVPHIQVEDLLQSHKGEITYPFKSHKLPEALKDKKLKIVLAEENPNIELTQQDGFIVLNAKDPKAVPNIKFNLVDETADHTSQDLYTTRIKLAEAPARVSKKMYFFASGALVLIMLAALVFYYTRPKRAVVVYEPERTTIVPGLGPGNVPRNISLADNYGQNNILDLRDAQNKDNRL